MIQQQSSGSSLETGSAPADLMFPVGIGRPIAPTHWYSLNTATLGLTHAGAYEDCEFLKLSAVFPLRVVAGFQEEERVLEHDHGQCQADAAGDHFCAVQVGITQCGEERG